MKPKDEDKPFERFRELVRRLVQVPKKELDKLEAAYQRRKAKRKHG
jgi:hypothetical protein